MPSLASLVSISLLVGSLSATSIIAQDDLGTDPILAVAANPISEPTPTIRDYVHAADLVDEAGTNGAIQTEKWSVLEPAPGEFALDDFLGGLGFSINAYDHTVMLGIQLINTTDREVPPDLVDVPFDDPQMLDRFHALFDALLPHLDEHVRYLSIGNEVDVYLANHPDEWATYKQFYEGALAYVHQVAPWIEVGVTSTFGGAVQHEQEVADLNELSDVYILTYYPLAPDFTVLPADSPLTNFPRMVELADGRPIVLQEVGYPSSAGNASSEAMQAQFVTNVFTAWENEADHIPMLSFFLLHDLPPALCDELTQYYGITGYQPFWDYLCSLGFRQIDGTPKIAWDTFVEQAAAHGF